LSCIILGSHQIMTTSKFLTLVHRYIKENEKENDFA
jgi:hypothetical protein